MLRTHHTEMTHHRYLTRCILETLRLWPAVGNGTFRTIERDEVISAGPGRTARLPKGTFVQVNSWSRYGRHGLGHVFFFSSSFFLFLWWLFGPASTPRIDQQDAEPPPSPPLCIFIPFPNPCP